MKQLPDLIKRASRMAEKAMSHKGTVPMFYLAVTHDGEQLVAGVHPVLDKDAIAILLGAYFQLRNVVRYVLVTEAWQVEAFDPARPDFKENVERAIALASRSRLREHPNAVEVVMFSGEDQNAGMITATRRIVRGRRYKATLGPLRFDESKAKVETQGRYVGLLARRADQRVQ